MPPPRPGKAQLRSNPVIKDSRSKVAAKQLASLDTTLTYAAKKIVGCVAIDPELVKDPEFGNLIEAVRTWLVRNTPDVVNELSDLSDLT